MSRIDLPDCLRALLERVYPDVDLGAVTLHEGLPFYAFRDPAAITVGPYIYFRAGKYDACSADGVALVAHELFHIRQGAGGFGFWFLRPFYLRYAWHTITSGFKRGREHPLERPAYAIQDRVRDTYRDVQTSSGHAGPCICDDSRPVDVDQVFIDAFVEAFKDA